MSKADKELFGPSGAYARAYGLFTVAQACGTIFGPTFAGILYEKEGWTVAVCALAAFCASGIIPVVSMISRLLFLRSSIFLLSLLLTLFDHAYTNRLSSQMCFTGSERRAARDEEQNGG